MTHHKHISTAALVVAMLALVASLGGGSYAAKLLTGKDIQNGSLTGKDIKKNSVKGKQIKDKSLTGGYISLQAESHPIEFRKVEMLPLAD